MRYFSYPPRRLAALWSAALSLSTGAAVSLVAQVAAAPLAAARDNGLVRTQPMGLF